jgi:hypothetical protein
MLQDTPEAPHGFKGGGKAPIILPYRFASVPSPPLARRVRHDREWTRAQPRVPHLIPRVNAGEVEVAAVCGDVEGGNHSGTIPVPSQFLQEPSRPPLPLQNAQ